MHIYTRYIYIYISARYLGFCVFWGYLGLIQPQNFRRKKTPTNPIRKRLGRGTLNTYAKLQGQTLKNGVDIGTFVR